MTSNATPKPDEPAPRTVRVLAPRMAPVITDGVISIVLTDSYRLNPYVADAGSLTTNSGTAITESTNMPLKYVLGTDLDATKMWLENPLPNGLRAMDFDWVLFYDSNPDLMLVESLENQNAYLATRDHLGLPDLRWAADLRFMAERQARAVASADEAV
ncbi:hypothetical protein EKO04_008629 [Ascochyta lentis]|uniref:Uncharacterized protein n=1 Tax=Ascochyta lentis TaxID=205686 RepID=A0A8H7MFR4_9PLEO|nr:hypothetical protein EKO04_008629 [Ascochyta lentis]